MYEFTTSTMMPPMPLAPCQPMPVATVPKPSNVNILRHCRCQDCRHWIKAPYSMCKHGLIVNGVKAVPEYPADEWHYCAMYHGPQVSKEVWVWPRSVVEQRSDDESAAQREE